MTDRPPTFPGPVEARIAALADRVAAGASPPPDDGFDYADPRDVAEDALRYHLDRIPSEFRLADLAALTDGTGGSNQQHPDLIARWLDDPDARTLWFAGDVGTGKSHAASAVSTEYLVRALTAGRVGRQTGWVSVASFLQGLRFVDPAEGREAVRRAGAVPLVVFDDVAQARVTEFAVETLLGIINTRVERGLRQVVTTNSTFPRLAETWGRPTVDRLTANAASLTFTGESLRKPLAWQPAAGGAR